MAGIYLHIPFCKKACHYCDFHFSTSVDLKSQMVEAMTQELTQNSNYIGHELVETIYFGGGTPSLLCQAELESLLNHIRSLFNVAEDAEITLEANPDDLDQNKLRQLYSAGINRLSIGVQSFRDSDLKWMNRVHTADEAIRVVKNAQDLGYDNITIDLIYGLPDLTNEDWLKNVRSAIALNVQHVSAYSLTVEPKTVLQKWVSEGKVKLDDECFPQQLQTLKQVLSENGFDHYELSNFAKPGFQSKHNSAYWEGKTYLGVGPSAHSYNGVSRRWNVANNPQYVKRIASGQLVFEEETLSSSDKINEFLMTRLRTAKGFKLADFNALPEVNRQLFQSELAPWIKSGHARNVANTISLTEKGLLISDSIIASLFQ